MILLILFVKDLQLVKVIIDNFRRLILMAIKVQFKMTEILDLNYLYCKYR